MADITEQPSATPAGASADYQKTSPTVSKPASRTSAVTLILELANGGRFWTDAIERLERYLEERSPRLLARPPLPACPCSPACPAPPAPGPATAPPA